MHLCHIFESYKISLVGIKAHFKEIKQNSRQNYGYSINLLDIQAFLNYPAIDEKFNNFIFSFIL